MLFELTKFHQLIEFSFEWKGFTITKYIRNIGRLYSQIEIQHQSKTKKFTLPYDWMWNQMGQTLVIWKNKIPLILYQNVNYRCIIKYTKTGWKNYYYTLADWIKKVCLLLNIENQKEAKLQDLYNLSHVISRAHFSVSALIDINQPKFISTLMANSDLCPVRTFIFDKNWIHLPHIYGSSLYSDDGTLKTLHGNYQLPMSALPCNFKSIPLGQWLGKYYVIGTFKLKLLVPWNLEYVKYMSECKRNIISTILFCIKRKDLYKYIGPAIWKTLIIPKVVFDI